MMEMDELFARLRKLEPIAPEREFSRSVQRRGRERLRAGALKSPLASTVVAGAVIAYLGWALHFTSGLYR
jgi:type VI protein secretion system component VasF